MTQQEAQAEAVRKWPTMQCGFGVVQEGWVEEKAGLHTVGVRRFAVGGEFQPIDVKYFINGYGKDFESAFAYADRRGTSGKQEVGG